MTVNSFQKRHVTSAFMCCMALVLSACGGGSGDSPATANASGSSSSASSSSSGGNQGPSISGTPAVTVVVGGSYTFTPAASDPNGDTLAFSRTGTLPPGLSFNTATGALTGNPTAIGTYPGIVISVSDGRGGTASLPAFTITVASATGSAVLTWTMPTQNTDGSPLTDLTGYRVYYGTNPASLASSVSIASGTTTTTIPNLPTGVTYYFAIASVSVSGGEGNKSNVASKTI